MILLCGIARNANIERVARRSHERSPFWQADRRSVAVIDQWMQMVLDTDGIERLDDLHVDKIVAANAGGLNWSMQHHLI